MEEAEWAIEVMKEMGIPVALTMGLGPTGDIHNQWRIQDFPEEGAPTPQGGAPTYDFARISQKLHEIERIWTPRGGRASPAPPLDPPLITKLRESALSG